MTDPRLFTGLEVYTEIDREPDSHASKHPFFGFRVLALARPPLDVPFANPMWHKSNKATIVSRNGTASMDPSKSLATLKNTFPYSCGCR
jgi:hypothetical protein